ncbi:MAG TPA: hypothetical protein VLE94_19395 [Burkholderiaceae bacterium]|nr:hypothetical protein [Burkholderiaceae bacterium]
MQIEPMGPGRWRSGRATAALALVAAAASGGALAMGGHFDVDDAAVLAPQRCQVELWALRGESARLAHLGPACRAGPVEVGLAFERLSEDAQRDAIVGAQVKWVTALAPQLDVGLVGSASRDTTRGVDLWTAYVPVTWSVGEAVQLHANVGVDRLGDRGRSERLGIAGEWAVDSRVTLLVERFRLFDATATRAGVRLALREAASLDLSAARVSGSGNRIWGLGWSFEFGR